MQYQRQSETQTHPKQTQEDPKQVLNSLTTMLSLSRPVAKI